jgi:hypothetical protein
MQPFDSGHQQRFSWQHISKNPAAQAFLVFCLTPWNEPFEAVWLSSSS